LGAPGSTAAKNSPSHRTGRQLSKLAFPQFALLEQNLQISHHASHSCECKTQYEMPAYSVVKERCVLNFWTVPLPVERSPHLPRGETIKNPASSAGPSRPQIYGRVRAMLD